MQLSGKNTWIRLKKQYTIIGGRMFSCGPGIVLPKEPASPDWFGETLIPVRRTRLQLPGANFIWIEVNQFKVDLFKELAANGRFRKAEVEATLIEF